MQFEFQDYFKVSFVACSIMFILCIIEIIAYIIVFSRKHPIGANNHTVKFLLGIITSIVIIYFLCYPLIHGIHLISEKASDKIESNGIITEITNAHGIDKYMYDNHVTYASYVYIDNERYYIMHIGDFKVGDEVSFEYLPKSKIILSINGTSIKYEDEITFWGEYTMNDLSSTDSLTNEYDLIELLSFFENSNVKLVFDTNKEGLTFSEVNNKYPIEITRSTGYSIYKVVQGGFFYVFWAKQLDVNDNVTSEPVVYFSSYLPSNPSVPKIDSLVLGISTAQDVRKIDPYFELSFLHSSGVFSYSYIDANTLLEIEYEYHENISDYEDLIVKKITQVPRNSSTSQFSIIFPNDLP